MEPSPQTLTTVSYTLYRVAHRGNHTITSCFTAYQMSNFSVPTASRDHIHPDCYEVTFQLPNMAVGWHVAISAFPIRPSASKSLSSKSGSRTSLDKLGVLLCKYLPDTHPLTVKLRSCYTAFHSKLLAEVWESMNSSWSRFQQKRHVDCSLKL